jgi:hypothetical protein
VGWLQRQAAAVAPCGLARGARAPGRRTAPYRGSERPSYPRAPPYSLPTPPGAGAGAGFARAAGRAGRENTSKYTHEPPSGLIPSLCKLPHSRRAISWYVFVALVLVVTIGAALLIAMWLEHRNPPPPDS